MERRKYNGGKQNQQNDGIGKTVGWIKENYNRSFTVEELARSSNMNVSGLHHKFKAVTTMAPLQDIKASRRSSFPETEAFESN